MSRRSPKRNSETDAIIGLSLASISSRFRPICTPPSDGPHHNWWRRWQHINRHQKKIIIFISPTFIAIWTLVRCWEEDVSRPRALQRSYLAMSVSLLFENNWLCWRKKRRLRYILVRRWGVKSSRWTATRIVYSNSHALVTQLKGG